MAKGELSDGEPSDSRVPGSSSAAGSTGAVDKATPSLAAIARLVLGASAGGPAAPPPPPLLLKDDPAFAKYFKMLSMHLPRQAVLLKLRADGHDEAVLDMDPNSPSPNQPQASSLVGQPLDPRNERSQVLLIALDHS